MSLYTNVNINATTTAPLSRANCLGQTRLLQQSGCRARPCKALFGWGEKTGQKSAKELEREEEYRRQQEVLARRKNNSWQKEVKDRRARVTRYMKDPDFKKVIDEENRKKFLEKKAAEAPEPKFGIIIPLIPIGMPEYDGGERFDLRLPYVDNGWVDDEADFGKQIGRFFGFGRNQNKKRSLGKEEDRKSK